MVIAFFELTYYGNSSDTAAGISIAAEVIPALN